MKTRMIAMTVVAAGAFLLAGDARACGCGCAAPAPKKVENKVAAAEAHGYTTINTEGLKKLLAAGKKALVFDARFGKYDDGRRIEGATQLGANASAKDIAKAAPDKNAKIVLYCTNLKCPASKTLAHKMVALGYKNIVKYPDGIEGWVAAGNKATKEE